MRAALAATFGEEMRILILHGMLHLMGYDHETDTGEMDRRERRCAARWGWLSNGDLFSTLSAFWC